MPVDTPTQIPKKQDATVGKLAAALNDDVARMMLRKMGKKFQHFVPTQALQMDFAFSVQTPSGTVVGKAGDWLAMDANGRFYPIDADTFSSTYRPARVRTKNAKSSKKD